jgi:hypothetical protein
MEAVARAILKDNVALKRLGAAVIDAEGYRLPENALLGGLLEAVKTYETAGKNAFEKGQAEEPQLARSLVSAQIKNRLKSGAAILKGFGKLAVHAEAYRLPDNALLLALDHVVKTYDADNEKREAWQEAGARFLQQKNQPRGLRKSKTIAASPAPKSPSPAANDDGSQPTAPQASKVSGMEAG